MKTIIIVSFKHRSSVLLVAMCVRIEKMKKTKKEKAVIEKSIHIHTNTKPIKKWERCESEREREILYIDLLTDQRER